VGKHRRAQISPSPRPAHGRARREAPLTGARSASACHASRAFSPIGRSWVGGNPISWRAVKGVQALAPSPAWSPGRRGQIPIPAAAPVFSSPTGQTVHTPTRRLYIPAKCGWSNSLRSHALCGYRPRERKAAHLSAS